MRLTYHRLSPDLHRRHHRGRLGRLYRLLEILLLLKANYSKNRIRQVQTEQRRTDAETLAVTFSVPLRMNTGALNRV